MRIYSLLSVLISNSQSLKRKDGVLKNYSDQPAILTASRRVLKQIINRRIKG
jgi:hypothetical protein